MAFDEAALGMLRVRLDSGAFAVGALLLARTNGVFAALLGTSSDSVLRAGFLVLGTEIGGISFSVVAGLLGSLGRGIVNDLK
ncbi:hypothetical protein RGQ30_13220 [Limnobacter thiooxidans]|uniref:Uncharacterized protein n=1 Tax=Limnobacter thiooxidans TaxID=131080 RepID=A0AA86JF47_9BURK|nr:hypothetical protein RGQ30_13220 [Limnobacter thiooxidans]